MMACCSVCVFRVTICVQVLRNLITLNVGENEFSAWGEKASAGPELKEIISNTLNVFSALNHFSSELCERVPEAVA
jgi:hypothetical protein